MSGADRDRVAGPKPTPTERWLDVDGTMVHTVTWAPAASDPGRAPMMLVHGLGGCTINWESVGGALATRRGAPVTAIDLVGFGRTALQGRRATLATNGRLVASLLEQHGSGPAVIVGNSMGGAIGVGLAARRPDLVAALVLVNPALPRPRGAWEHWPRAARLAALTVPRLGAPVIAARVRALGPERVVDSTLAVVLRRPERLDPEVRERLVALARAREHDPDGPAAYAQAAASIFGYLTWTMRSDMGRVECPTLIVHGRNDALVPVGFARAAAARRPDWRLEEVPDCGHAPMLELPDRFVELVADFGAGPGAAEGLRVGVTR